MQELKSDLINKESTIEQLQEQLDQMSTDIHTLHSQNQEYKDSINSQQNDNSTIEQLQEKLNQMSAEMKTLRTQRDGYSSSMVSHQNNLKDCQAKLNACTRDHPDQIRALSHKVQELSEENEHLQETIRKNNKQRETQKQKLENDLNEYKVKVAEGQETVKLMKEKKRTLMQEKEEMKTYYENIKTEVNRNK